MVATTLSITLSAPAQATDVSVQTKSLSVTILGGGSSYEVQIPGDARATLRARVAAKIDQKWVELTDYPRHQVSEATFEGDLGAGRQVTVSSSGLHDEPDLTYTVRLYDALPFGDIAVEVQNRTSKAVTVQAIRTVEAIGDPLVNLQAADSADRVLSDSFAEDWPPGSLSDLGKAPHGMHRAVGSQLIYNRESKRSLFVGALSSERFLTIMHLKTRTDASGTRIASYTIDSTGTTEVVRRAPGEDLIELSLRVLPESKLSSEPLMFAVGTDYHGQLEAYGAAIRQLHHARVQGGNLMGWWSWLPYGGTINEGAVMTTAQWEAAHLKCLGYVFLQIDEGYDYTRGEYATPNAAQFPGGMRRLMREVTRLGLKPGIWAAPFVIESDSWVYEHHKNWLVHNARGEPLFLGPDGDSEMFALDPTHPGAQEYLRLTYRKMVREWGVRYIKLDLMNFTTVEGYYYRPHTTALEAQRIGLAVIRKAVGEDVLLDKDDSPMLNTVGIVDEGRISGDMAHSYEVTKAKAPGIAARYYMHRNFFIDDPDAFSVQEVSRRASDGSSQAPLSLSEAQVAIALAAVSGGMFEIGDDLPTLGFEPDRLRLVTNPDLLQIATLGRVSMPVDLLTYSPQDEQPSAFLLREDQRQWMLAVFNWTEQPKSRALRLADLGLPTEHSLRLHDVLAADQPLALEKGAIRLGDEPAHSVRVIKIIDESKPAAAPTIRAQVPAHAEVGERVSFTATAAEGVPALTYHWDFGDGTAADGKTQEHSYTLARTYAIRLTADGVDGVPAHATFSLVVQGEAAQGPPRRYVDPTD